MHGSADTGNVSSVKTTSMDSASLPTADNLYVGRLSAYLNFSQNDCTYRCVVW